MLQRLLLVVVELYRHSGTPEFNYYGARAAFLGSHNFGEKESLFL